MLGAGLFCPFLASKEQCVLCHLSMRQRLRLFWVWIWGLWMNEEGLTTTKKGSVFLRLLGFVLRYRLRVLAGSFLALFVSLSNILSLGGLLPILEIIGTQQTKNVFKIKLEEKKALTNQTERRERSLWERLELRIALGKQRLNSFLSSYTPKEAIFILCAFICCIHFLKTLSLSACTYFIGTAGLGSVRDIRMKLYRKLQSLGMEFFNQEKTGAIMSRAINDGELVGRLLSVHFTEILIDIFYIATHLIFLLWISWKMSFFALFLAPILLIPINMIGKRVRRVSTSQQKRFGYLLGHLQEFMSGIRVIRAFAREKTEYQRFSIINQNLCQNTFLKHYYHYLSPTITELIAMSTVLFFFVWGAYEVSRGEISHGLFFIFFLVLTFVLQPIKRISLIIGNLNTATSAAQRIFELIDKKIELQEKENPKELESFQEAIQYKNVSFLYPGTSTKALANISFQIKQGEDVALVGSSGSGKSTLIDLLLRLYDIQEGSISIDKINIRDLSLRSLRSSIGVVSQDVFLFNASISENIAYGQTHIPLERIKEAAREAQAHDFIEKIPGTYEALIGERGIMLSGGQRQRIAIARTLLLDPAILILDEATSSLDNESEHYIQQALEKLCVGRTVLKIAHRLSTIYKSQRILVLDKGRIVEEGNHEELLKKRGKYYKLYTGQVKH